MLDRRSSRSQNSSGTSRARRAGGPTSRRASPPWSSGPWWGSGSSPAPPPRHGLFIFHSSFGFRPSWLWSPSLSPFWLEGSYSSVDQALPRLNLLRYLHREHSMCFVNPFFRISRCQWMPTTELFVTILIFTVLDIWDKIFGIKVMPVKCCLYKSCMLWCLTSPPITDTLTLTRSGDLRGQLTLYTLYRKDISSISVPFGSS